LVVLRRCFLLPLASALHDYSTGCRTVARTRTEPRDTNPKRVANGLKSNEKLFYILANIRADGRTACRPSLDTDLTRNTRAPHFNPQHWLLCHMGLY